MVASLRKDLHDSNNHKGKKTSAFSPGKKNYHSNHFSFN